MPAAGLAQGPAESDQHLLDAARTAVRQPADAARTTNNYPPAVPDPAIRPANFENKSPLPIATDANAERSDRRAAGASPGLLLPPSGRDAHGAPQTGLSRPPQAAGKMPSMVTVVGSTCLVLSLFLAATWLMKRSMPRSARTLSRDVVEVWGRTQLTRGQDMHLVRCGNKVLLIAIAGTTAQTLTEIYDPREIDRLRALCGAFETGGRRGATPLAEAGNA
ncbi:MAG: flagellar biosynthetic protein FliO [Planctomycetia bacterium]|nr:flagellar biosynthetic protein FliO [Planctomycetia bacterium]